MKKEPIKVIECGCCLCYHRVDYHGDCRNDDERFSGWDEFEARFGRELDGKVIEVFAEEDFLPFLNADGSISNE